VLAGDDSEALRADACGRRQGGRHCARGHWRRDGELVACMGDVLAKLVNHPERGALSANDEREQTKGLLHLVG
jgi:hypothetical protein